MNDTTSKLVFAFSSYPGYEVQTLFLLRSLREFGGAMANLPVWVFIPAGKMLSSEAKNELASSHAEIYHFQIDDTIHKFPFALKTLASAQAERMAEEQQSILAWHDLTGFICNPPLSFNLPDSTSIAFRPTDIANIGAPYGQPLPPFWQTICDHFQLTPDQFPLITTVIDQIKLHLYINAGLLVVRPEKGILQTWAKNLKETYALPEFKSFYQLNSAYAVFMHQAALTAAVIQKTSVEERSILPDTYLFSVDNYFDYAQDMRPILLDEIATGRFHDFFALENWEDKILANKKLIRWFKTQLEAGPYWPG